MKTYSSILCQIMIGALMSIGMPGQAASDLLDVNLGDENLEIWDEEVLFIESLTQNESSRAKNQIQFIAVKKPEGFMEGFLSLHLNGSYKKVYINFYFDSEIISPATVLQACDADHVHWRISKHSKKLNNYTVEIDNYEGKAILISFLFKAPFNMPKHVFISAGDHPMDLWEFIDTLLPATTNENPSTEEYPMKSAPDEDLGAYVQRERNRRAALEL